MSGPWKVTTSRSGRRYSLADRRDEHGNLGVVGTPSITTADTPSRPRHYVVDVAVIEDTERGITYEVTAGLDEGKPVVTSLHLLPHHDRPVTQQMLRSVPLDRLARTAWSATQRPTHADGVRLLHLTTRAGTWERPSKEQVAEMYHRAANSGDPRSPRRFINEETGTPLHTIDRLIRRARDAGLIEPNAKGRPRKGPQA